MAGKHSTLLNGKPASIAETCCSSSIFPSGGCGRAAAAAAAAAPIRVGTSGGLLGRRQPPRQNGVAPRRRRPRRRVGRANCESAGRWAVWAGISPRRARERWSGLGWPSVNTRGVNLSGLWAGLFSSRLPGTRDILGGLAASCSCSLLLRRTQIHRRRDDGDTCHVSCAAPVRTTRSGLGTPDGRAGEHDACPLGHPIPSALTRCPARSATCVLRHLLPMPARTRHSTACIVAAGANSCPVSTVDDSDTEEASG
jgi:hypothetical protein